jgi:hypothetical protein
VVKHIGPGLPSVVFKAPRSPPSDWRVSFESLAGFFIFLGNSMQNAESGDAALPLFRIRKLA